MRFLNYKSSFGTNVAGGGEKLLLKQNIWFETKRLMKYSVTGISTFAIDFTLLWFLTDVLNIQYLLSGGIAFVTGISINYPLARKFAFPETERKVGSGYFYFLTIGVLGLVLTVALLAFFVEILSLHYLTARLCTATFVGLWNYVMNATLNFGVLKKN